MITPPELVPLFQVSMTIGEPALVFSNQGLRAPVAVTGGRFTGERLSGDVLPGSVDWTAVDAANIFHIDVRAILRVDDGPIVLCTYNGRVAMPDDGLGRIMAGETLGPDELYFRAAPTFITDAGDCAWLNGIQAIAVGTMGPGSVSYDVFEVR
jgi:hypothetical protein